jgi:uncharacterized protein YukE|tara:strand:- start:4314 stop:5978 length:1665 start_codon:yes stop_codon:yes gene_type:complete
MGLKKATVKLGADTRDFTSKMRKASQSFKRLNKDIKAVGKSMSVSLTAPLTAFAAASVKAFDEQAQAEAKLLTALKGNETAFNELTDAAQKFQELSLFGDEEIIAQQAYLASLGLTTDKINDVIAASMDLAAGTGQTLSFGVKNLAKTFSGLTGELGESIPALKNLTKEQLIAGEAVDVVAEAFEGQAKAASEAGLGGVQQLKNSFGDLTEEIGRALMPMLNDLTKTISDIVGGMKLLTDAQIKAKVETGLFVAAIGPVLIAISSFFSGLRKLKKEFLNLARFVIPLLLEGFGLITGAISIFLTTSLGPFIAAGAAIVGSLYAIMQALFDAEHAQVVYNSAQKESIALTKEQADAIDNITVPFVEGAERAKEFAIQLDKVSQVTSIDGPDSLVGGLKEVTHELTEVQGEMSQLGFFATNVFSTITDRALQFQGTFGNVIKEIGIMLGKMLLKMAVMAAFMSVISGGGGVGRLGFSFAEAFNMQLGIEGRAKGGFVSGNTPYIVGERGPELFVPSSSGSIVANHNLGGSSIPDVRISGDDLLIVFDRANRRKARR